MSDKCHKRIQQHKHFSCERDSCSQVKHLDIRQLELNITLTAGLTEEIF
jgi:hypothetical protein